MNSSTIRIGIVGAGANTRKRHLPGFQAIDGVSISGVVNRTPESTKQVASDYGIPHTFESWDRLIASDEIDAVLIGTWPYRHCEITCAALNAGKHVLCEARMACDLAEARKMLETSQQHPDLVTQIVPSPFGLVQHQYVQQLLETEFLGELRELVVIGASDLFADPTQPLHWRQDRTFSGKNILAMGILHESALRWTPPPVRVFAQTAIFEKERPASSRSENTQVTVPDSVQIVTQLENGGRGLYHLSGVAHFGPGMQIHLYGSRGTIKLELGDPERLFIGKAGDQQLQEVNIPDNLRGGWRVEEEFISAIRGQEQVRFTDFATGVKYMEFTEAVHRSAETNLPVDLPLEK
ncbi:MAG: Gfo/Idh/MocA family oxidoreductase [Planctomycetaceae bacterium]